MNFLNDAFSIDWQMTLTDFLRVAFAFLLAVPIGCERHQSERNLGLRTFPIVAMAYMRLYTFNEGYAGCHCRNACPFDRRFDRRNRLYAAARF